MNKNNALHAKDIKKRNLTTRFSEKKSQKPVSVTVLNHNQNSETSSNFEETEIDLADQISAVCKSKSKYSTPTLQTTLNLIRKINHLKLNNASNDLNFNELTPRTKSIVTERALKKLNFTNGQRLYTKLEPMNVNDAVLEVRPKSQHKKKREYDTEKDPIPDLSNYLRPINRSEHRIEFQSDNDDDKPNSHFNVNDHLRRMFDFYETNLTKLPVYRD